MKEKEFLSAQAEYIKLVDPERFTWQTEHPYIKRQEEVIWAKLPNLDGLDVLEFACGEGANLSRLLNRNPRIIVALDISLPRIQHVKKCFPSISVLVGDITALPFRTESFDFICSRDVFHHLLLADKKKVLNSLPSLLRPKGAIFLIEPNSRNLIVQLYGRLIKEEAGLQLNRSDDYIELIRQTTAFPHIEVTPLCSSIFGRLLFHYRFGLRAIDKAWVHSLIKWLDKNFFDNVLPKSRWAYFQIQVTENAPDQISFETTTGKKNNKADFQRSHYDNLVKTKRRTKGLSCGFEDRFDPFVLRKDPDFKHFCRILIENLFPHKVGIVLDIGCGTGYYLPELSERSSYIVGIDISLAMLKVCNQFGSHCGLRFSLEQAKVENLPFKDNSIDAVIGMDVLHHLENPDSALNEIKRVLKQNGIFVGFEPNILNPVTFLAHLLPSEERGALRTNLPWRLKSLLFKHFLVIDFWGENFVLTRAGVISRIISKVFNILNPFHMVGTSLRLAFRAQPVNKKQIDS